MIDGAAAEPSPTNNKRARQGFLFLRKHLLRAFLLCLPKPLPSSHPPQGTKLSPKKAQATAMHLVI